MAVSLPGAIPMQHLELNGRPAAVENRQSMYAARAPGIQRVAQRHGPAVSDVTIDTAGGEFQLTHNILILFG